MRASTRTVLEMVNLREQCSWVHKDKGEATRKAKDLVAGRCQEGGRAPGPLPEGDADVEGGPRHRRRHRRHISRAAARQLGIQGAHGREELQHRRPDGPAEQDLPDARLRPVHTQPAGWSMSASNPNIDLLHRSRGGRGLGLPGELSGEGTHRGRKGSTRRSASAAPSARRSARSRCRTSSRSASTSGRRSTSPSRRRSPHPMSSISRTASSAGRAPRSAPRMPSTWRTRGGFQEVDVGAIIVATGFDMFDVKRLHEYDTSLPDVITATQMERLMINECGAGMVLKRKSDGNRVKKVAFVLCAGSRTRKVGVPYCSKICCNYAIKQSVILQEDLPVHAGLRLLHRHPGRGKRASRSSTCARWRSSGSSTSTERSRTSRRARPGSWSGPRMSRSAR